VPHPRLLVRGGVATFVVLVAAQHLLRPELPPAERFVSEYGRGSTAALQVTAFAGWGVATAACAVLAARAGRRPIARWITVGGLAIATAGLALCGAFTTQTVGGEMPPGLERSVEGRLHDLGALLILAGLIGAGLASLRLIEHARYRLISLALAAGLLAIVPALTLVGWDAPGIGQRGFILVGLLWELAFAGAATSAARAPEAAAARRRLSPRYEGARG
jgi:hypothetical protein